ncbi:MAG: cysteine desulfurase [Gammaproteobacteria bacterium]|nr:cysteine desulfurase [Gammaproteobacteria bacterium]
MSVYLDHNATTPVDPAVWQAMQPYLQDAFGNPSSQHAPGRRARAAVERAREQVAGLVNARGARVVFTSGGTEANSLALLGAAPGTDGAVVLSAIEHSSVLGPARVLAARGCRVDFVTPDAQGRIPPAALDEAIAPDTRLVSVMAANNETGVIQDIAALAGRARARGALMHTDAVQAAGKIGLDFAASGVHLMSLSAHKICGPKGVGALVVHKGVDLEPLIQGGGQEMGLRAGTENVAGIVGFGAAAELAQRTLEARAAQAAALQERLEARLRAIAGTEIFGVEAARLANTVFFAVAGIDGATLLLKLDQAGFAAASGSACASAQPDPSHVLLAMGVDRERAYGAIRISFGAGNTPGQVDAFADTLGREIEVLRGMALRETA